MPVRALHLSDLHLTDDPAQVEAIVQALANDIHHRWTIDRTNTYQPSEPKLFDADDIDLIIVSGDLTSHATDEQFSCAYDFLDKICKEFLGGNRERVVIVPGNHDVSRAYSKLAYKPAQIYKGWQQDVSRPESQIRSTVNPDGQVELYERHSNHAYEQRLSGFAKLVGEFYSAREYPIADPGSQFLIFDALARTHGLIVVGFSSVDQLDHLWFRGRIAEAARVNAFRKLDLDYPRDEYDRIAVWHHGLFSWPGHDDYIDPSDVLSFINNGFCLALHGHVHTTGHTQLADLRFSLPTIWTGLSYTPVPERDGRPFRYNALTLDLDLRLATVHVRRTDQPSNSRRVQPWRADCGYGPGSRPFFEVLLPRNSHAPLPATLAGNAATRALQRRLLTERKRQANPGRERDQIAKELYRVGSEGDIKAVQERLSLTIQREIGAGGISIVYEAYDDDGNHFALKMLQDRHLSNPSIVKAFWRGFDALKALAPGGREDIVTVHDKKGDYAYTMGLVDGESLQTRASRPEFINRPLVDRLRLFEKLTAPLSYAHEQRIFHGDVCPANFIVRRDSDDVVLADFDYAEAPEMTAPTAFSRGGHFKYTAPEVSEGSSPNAESDIYSLGLVLYYLMTGKDPEMPIDALLIREQIRRASSAANAGMCDGVTQIVWNCIEPTPQRRYATISALLADVRLVMGGGSHLPRATGRWSIPKEDDVVSEAQINRFALAGWVIAGLCFAELVLAAGYLHKSAPAYVVILLFGASSAVQIYFGGNDVRLMNEARALSRRDQIGLLFAFILAVATMVGCAAYYLGTGDLRWYVGATLTLAVVNACTFGVSRRRLTTPGDYADPTAPSAIRVMKLQGGWFPVVRQILVVICLSVIAAISFATEASDGYVVTLLVAGFFAQELPMYWWRWRTLWRSDTGSRADGD